MVPARTNELRAAAVALLLPLALPPLAAVGCAGPRGAPPRSAAETGFRVSGELELPGPLDPAGARVPDPDVAAVEIGAGGRRWRVPAGDDGGWGLPVELPAPPPAPDAPPAAGSAEGPGWSVSPDGRVRARIDDGGFLIAERSCRRCRDGYRRLWRTRLPARAAVRPLVTERRIHAGLLDNRVYAFRRRNGHRIWDADVGSRVLLPLGRSASGAVLVPVAPGGAAALVALDPTTGAERARLALPPEATPVGGPVTLPGGDLAWAFEEYDPSRARLWRISGSP